MPGERTTLIKAGQALVLVATGLCFALAQAQDPGDRRARQDYLLHCSGCHDIDGSGHPTKGIPDFRGQIGYFTAIPEGRAMLMQVPGLLSAGLSDERRAAVTTWLVRKFAGNSLPKNFLPYTAEEANRYRKNRPVDITAKRAELYRRIVEAGYKDGDR
jgi:mono/diheme cytochrome c family protein